jgi:DNA primase small subunit
MYPENKEAIFLKKHFADYYNKNFIDTVPQIEKREFGFGVFRRKIANRNLAFTDASKMNYFLRNSVPLFFSYSNSYYAHPANTPMSSKNWIASDLIYEFDSDEIKTECNKVNGNWVCKKSFGQDAFITQTTNSGETKQWFLKKGLSESKKQVFRLIEFLENDLGFDKSGLAINFSGKAGYHVHLRNKEIQNLNKKSRVEIVDYITGQGIYFDNLGYDLDNSLSVSKSKGAWQKRINQGLIEFFDKSPEEIASITGLEKQKSKIRKYLENKDELIKKINEGYLIGFNIKKNKEFFLKIFQFIVQTYQIPIDRQTSIDLNKIIRVPNTLHGDTGLLAKIVPIKELDNFDPYKDAVVFGEEKIKVFVKEAPKFSLNNNDFGPFKEEEVIVPLYCAIYLIGKGAELRK